MANIAVETILDNMTEAMIIIRPDWEIVFFNKAATHLHELTGKPLKQGQSLYPLIPDESKPLAQFLVQQVGSQYVSQTTETECKHPHGYSLFLEVTYNPVLNTENQLEYICISARDITPQKTFERKASQLLRELSNLIESANAFIFGVDARGYVTDWNKESGRITGYEKNEVVAQRIEKLIDATHLGKFRALLDRVYQGEAISNVELQVRTATGNPLSLLLNVTPKKNSSDEVIGALFVGQDVTELAEYRRSLERKVKDRTQKLQEALQKEKELVEIKNKFVSIASHEFSTPLASINASVHFLEKNTGFNVKGKEKLENIATQVTHMKALLEDVLTIGKSEAGKLIPRRRQLELIAFLEKITAEVIESTQHTHAVVTDFAVTAIYLESDEKLLRNVVVNLLTNAIKFSPGKTKIKLRVWTERETVCLQVQDYGIGIDRMDIDRIFEPFNRGSNIGNIKGTGLGLSIVKKAVETLGGDFSVDSEVGVGTTFTVWFKNEPPSATNQ